MIFRIRSLGEMGVFSFIIRTCRSVIFIGAVVGVMELWRYVKDEYCLVNRTEVTKHQHDSDVHVEDGSDDTKQKVNKEKKKKKNKKKLEKAVKPVEQVSDEKEVASEKTQSDVSVTFEKGFADIAKKAKKSVVSISVSQLIEDPSPEVPDLFRGSPFDDFFKDFFDFPSRKSKPRRVQALGSGFIIKVEKDKMYVVTNHHVVEKAKKISIFLSDKTELQAEVHASDPRTDIAVVSVNLKEFGKVDRKKLQAMEWGDSDEICEGNFVIAIGNPFGFGNTVTNGIISSKGRNVSFSRTSLNLIDDYIQHSASINMGSSGGCLLDVRGKVIGINNAIITPNGGNIGIGFAIPSNIAKLTVDQLIAHKRTFRGWLGVEVHKVDRNVAESVGLTKKGIGSSQIFGAYVSKVSKNGPGEKAGIIVGDIIIGFNDQQITETKGLQTLVGLTPIGSDVKLKIWRFKEKAKKWGAIELTVKVGDFEEAMTLGKIDSENAAAGKNEKRETAVLDMLGIEVTALPKNDSRPDLLPVGKVVVSKCNESTDFSSPDSYFSVGDVILIFGNVVINSVGQFEKLVNAIGPTDVPIPVSIIRNGSRILIAVTLNHPIAGGQDDH
jgi:serine protease Do